MPTNTTHTRYAIRKTEPPFDCTSLGKRQIVPNPTAEPTVAATTPNFVDGVEVGEGAIVAAGSVVSPGTKVGAHELWMGVPARFKKMVDPAQAKEMNVKIAHNYLMYAKWYDEDK